MIYVYAKEDDLTLGCQLTSRKSNKHSATSVSLAQSAENSTIRCSCSRHDSTYRDRKGDKETLKLQRTCLINTDTTGSITYLQQLLRSKAEERQVQV